MVALLEVDHLYKRYGAVVVADDICCTVDHASCVGLIGPNGAGKSSLFNMLTGIIAPDDGVIRFEGREDRRHRGAPACATRHRARISDPAAVRAIERIRKRSDCRAVRSRASGHGAQQLAADVLNRTGLLAHADEPAGHLRLLDRKRLELAKAIASRAKLLLLDEIASGLTEHEVAALIDLIAALKADHAIIWIEHIPHALRAVADRIMVLHFGRKVLDGAPADVMSSPMVREIYMGLPADAA